MTRCAPAPLLPAPLFPWSGCKDKGAPVGAIGECLSCTAEAGVACRRPGREIKALAEQGVRPTEAMS